MAWIFYITRLLFERGLQATYSVVEYNSVFGPDAKITLQYQKILTCLRPHINTCIMVFP